MAKKAQIVTGVNADETQEFAPVVRGAGSGTLVGESTYAGGVVRVVVRESTNAKGQTAKYANVEGLDEYLRVGRQPVSARSLYNALYLAETWPTAELKRFRQILAKALAIETAEANNASLARIKHTSAQRAGNRADAAFIEAGSADIIGTAIAKAFAAAGIKPQTE